MDTDSQEDFQEARSRRDSVGNAPRSLLRREAIPELVLHQFDDQVHRMRPAVMLPLALLIRATGWRLSELLDLKIDACLDHDEFGWWLCSPRRDKRRVPITGEVALQVEHQRQRAGEGPVGDANKTRHLFVSSGKAGGQQGNYSLGNRIVKDQVRVALARLVQECGIVDDSGRLYHVTAGSLRRAKYIEMIHLGIDLSSIQHWMGDDSIFTALDFAETGNDHAYEAWVPRELRTAHVPKDEQKK